MSHTENAQKQLDQARATIAKAKGERDTRAAKLTALNTAVEAKIRDDAAGRKPYPETDREKDRKDIAALKTRISEDEIGIKALERELPALERAIASGKMDDAAAEMAELNTQGVECFRDFSEKYTAMVEAWGTLLEVAEKHEHAGRGKYWSGYRDANPSAREGDPIIGSMHAVPVELRFPIQMKRLEGWLRETGVKNVSNLRKWKPVPLSTDEFITVPAA